MARTVENVFVNVMLRNESEFVAQHQKLFPKNMIARWSIDGIVYIKVPYAATELKPVGLTREQFKVVLAPMEAASAALLGLTIKP